jgi:WD40 repeat protein
MIESPLARNTGAPEHGRQAPRNWLSLIVRFLCVAAAVLIVAVLCGLAAGQDRRRALKTPGIVIETGQPIAACYQLTFTRDGGRLLAAGADKVVRDWPFQDGRLDAQRDNVLRWATWREQRGTIYALALSPDEQNRYVAVGGFGMITGTIAVIDRQIRQVTRALTVPNSGEVITALAFSPSGRYLAYGTTHGAIWQWDIRSEKENDALRLGSHSQTDTNRIRRVAFLDERRVLSVAQDGSVFRWTVAGQRASGGELFRFGLQHVRDAVVAGDGTWLAATGYLRGANHGRLETRTIDGQHIKSVAFHAGGFPGALAVDHADRQLAIAVDTSSSLAYRPARGAVALYEVQSHAIRWAGIRPTYTVDAVAFHPGGQHMAVAGGNDFEISVWGLQANRMTERLEGPGRSLWQVALSADKSRVGFRDQRNIEPKGFNDWGTGQWRVFDLQQRDWQRRADDFRPAQPLETAGGWRVEPDNRDLQVWRVIGPDKRKHILPLDRDQDLQPRCYAFLQPAGGQPVRLAVGHRWGISIFDLGRDGPRRSRLMIGHAGDVTSVATSADRMILVSASRDQTISAWSLADWEHQPELGASFTIRDGRLLTSQVAAGSPAWEAGLNGGDEIVLLAFNGKVVAGGAVKWHEQLRNPVPGRELFFRVRRTGEAEPLDMLTTVRQRPLWRLFPTTDGEWVLWRWRDYFYDTSTKGDSYIGWQIVGDVGDTPEFHTAEKFRELFHKPDKIADIVAKTRFDPERVAIPQLLPPKVEIAVTADRGEDDLSVLIRAVPRDAGYLLEPREVSLWVNDHKFQRWTKVGERFDETIRVPRSLLRSGRNEIVAQAYNQAGARGDSARVQVTRRAAPPTPSVHGLFVGISDYTRAARAADGRRLWDNLLFSAEDARAIAATWQKQGQTSLYENSQVDVLLEGEATRQSVLEHLQRLKDRVHPDDLFVLFLAGHGYAERIRDNVFQPRSFVYACPTFDISRPHETGVTGSELYQAISALPCHKLLLLDCCHSGSTNILRELSPEGIGPVMIAACGGNESSYDIPFLGHGAFSNAILEAMDAHFAEVDTNRDNRLSVRELFGYIDQRVPRTIELARPVLGEDAIQTPQGFLPNPITIDVIAEAIRQRSGS